VEERKSTDGKSVTEKQNGFLIDQVNLRRQGLYHGPNFLFGNLKTFLVDPDNVHYHDGSWIRG
jgi:hypothetical protein